MGPFARFYKLDEQKQQRILDNAFEEFTAHGFENASLNTIISNSEISKGSFYYYFEDKMDLFVTVIRANMDVVEIVEASGLYDAEDAETFWDMIERMMRMSIEMITSNPGLIRLGMVFHQLDDKARQQGQMAIFLEEMGAVLTQLILHGQSIAAFRDDLPVEVILELWFAIDAVFDKWVLAQDFNVDDPRMIKIMSAAYDFFKRAFMP